MYCSNGYIFQLQMTVSNWKGEEGRKQVEEFKKEVIERMTEPPWNSTLAKENNLPVTV